MSNSHHEPCCLCGEMTNSLAGDPGRWPIRFGHEGGNGETFTHCGKCCAKMFNDAKLHRRMMSALLADSTPEPGTAK